MPRRRVILAVALTLTAIGTALLYYLSARRLPSVEVVEATRGDVVHAVTATSATIEPRQQIVIAADRSGRVAELRARLGQSVTRGDTIAVLRDPVLKAEVSQARLDIDRTQRSVERARALAQQGSIPPSELEAAEYDYRSALARMRTLEARQEQLIVRTPITGAVTAEHVKEGEVLGAPVEDGQRVLAFPVVTVSTTSDLIVTAHIDEADIANVRPGQGAIVTIEALEGRSLRGVVERVAPAPSLTTAGTTYEVIIRLHKPASSLVSGLRADVRVVVERATEALSAPKEAVFACGTTGQCLFAVRGDRAELRLVEIGIRDASRIEIRSGLAEGERVIVGFPPDLRDGTRVSVRPSSR